MSVGDALHGLAHVLSRLGIPASRVEIVMSQADVDRIYQEMGTWSADVKWTCSVQMISGFLVTGEASVKDHAGVMGEMVQ